MSSKRKIQNSKNSNNVENELAQLSGNNNFSSYLSGNNYNSHMNSINHSDVLLRSALHNSTHSNPFSNSLNMDQFLASSPFYSARNSSINSPINSLPNSNAPSINSHDKSNLDDEFDTDEDDHKSSKRAKQEERVNVKKHFQFIRKNSTGLSDIFKCDMCTEVRKIIIYENK